MDTNTILSAGSGGEVFVSGERANNGNSFMALKALGEDPATVTIHSSPNFRRMDGKSITILPGDTLWVVTTDFSVTAGTVAAYDAN